MPLVHEDDLPRHRPNLDPVAEERIMRAVRNDLPYGTVALPVTDAEGTSH